MNNFKYICICNNMVVLQDKKECYYTLLYYEKILYSQFFFVAYSYVSKTINYGNYKYKRKMQI